MNLSIRLAGALALAGGVAVAAVEAPSLTSHLDLPFAAALAGEDPILFYRAPMGEPELSKGPKKDGMGMDFLPVRRSVVLPLLHQLPASLSVSTDEPLFWRNAMGWPEISLTPKRDSMGMDFVPVRGSDIAGLLPRIGAQPTPAPAAAPALAEKAEEPGNRRILYYRNPMGLADTSPVPKKDAMGMDYRPVYEGEDDDSSTVKIAPGKMQRTGVRSESVQTQAIVSKIRAPGSIQLDERRIAVVAPRADAFIEKVSDVTTGDLVEKGQILMRLYSPEIASAAAQYLATPGFDGARTRLENLEAPPSVFEEIRRNRKVPLSIAWPSPRGGIVMERMALDGMKAEAGQALFRIADLSVVWALVDVSEQDYARVKPGQTVSLRVRGMPDKTFSGRVSLIYPQINKETRTARVRVELQNPELVLRPDQYVDAEIAASDGEKVIAAPESAVIDSGTKKLVILDLGDGRFEPREVKTGRHGGGTVEIREGVAAGDKVVTAANFLIDAESNLKTALKSFAQPEVGQ